MIAKNKHQDDIDKYFDKYKVIYPMQIAEGLGISITKAKEYFRNCRKDYRRTDHKYKCALPKVYFLEWYRQK